VFQVNALHVWDHYGIVNNDCLNGGVPVLVVGMPVGLLFVTISFYYCIGVVTYQFNLLAVIHGVRRVCNAAKNCKNCVQDSRFKKGSGIWLQGFCQCHHTSEWYPRSECDFERLQRFTTDYVQNSTALQTPRDFIQCVFVCLFLCLAIQVATTGDTTAAIV